MYNPKSKHAEEFISHEEILKTLEYAENNKDNESLINEILDKAKEKGVKIILPIDNVGATEFSEDAEVKTFKFTKNKNNQGTKESALEIEFFTNAGEKVNCSLNSFLYTETQEQYIDILYDESNPKNVVYYVNRK